jgi:transposase
VIQESKNNNVSELLTAFLALKTQFEFQQNQFDRLQKNYDAIASLPEKYELLQKKYDELAGKYLLAQHQIADYQRMIFGSKRERFLNSVNPSQATLDLDIEPLGEVAIKEQEITYTRKDVTVKKNQNHNGRCILPPHLRREVVTLEPDKNIEGLKIIGVDATEILELKPGEFFVIRYERAKYAKPGNQGVIVAPLPPMPIDKCIAGAYLLATILVDKYVFHLPEYRQLQRFKLSGIDIKKSTLNDWTNRTASLLQPLYEVLMNKVLASNYLMADETHIRVLDKLKKGTSHRGFYWVYNAPLDNIIFFRYHNGRGRDGPEPILKNFKGHLQTDAYQTYDYFGKQADITLANCMTHARRKFDKALTNDKIRAEDMLGQFQHLYEVERIARENNYDYQKRFELRQEKSLPLLETMHSWLIENEKVVKPSTPIGHAIAYCLKRWDKLCLYTTEGFLEIDTNQIENAIRAVALGRKNYLFSGSHDAAQRAAMIYSFFAICKKKDINPYLWLSDTLTKLANWKGPQSDLEKFLP